MANLIQSVLKMLSSASDLSLSWSAVPKIGSAVFSLRDDMKPSAFPDIMRERSEEAYKAYCEDRTVHSREDSIGIPDKQAVLDFWSHCMETDTMPGIAAFSRFAKASEEESEQMLKFLLGQWMTVPEFTTWLHGLANTLKQDEIIRILRTLPRLDSIVGQIRETLNTQLQNMRSLSQVQFITVRSVAEARSACTGEDVRNYYRINNSFPTMFPIICADRDVPHTAACEKLEQLTGGPVIITGNGGQGKSSLMLREAVRWAESGGVAVWMPLSAFEAHVLSEADAAAFYRALTDAVPEEVPILLCLENPYDGRQSLAALQRAWPGGRRIRLLLAERSNRLPVLADMSKDRLQGWFDNAYVLDLSGRENDGGAQLQGKEYVWIPMPEDPARRQRILETCASVFAPDLPQEQTAELVARVMRNHNRRNVSLAELIYRALFELLPYVSKPESVVLDWDEWERFLQAHLGVATDADMYGMIAAFKLFDTPLTLPFFCRFFELNARKLRSVLERQHVPGQIEPIVYNTESETLQPKHDMIAELFFLFHQGTVSIDRLTGDVIDAMDSAETEILLDQMVDKQEFLRGSAYRIPIHYRAYLERIRKRAAAGTIALGPGGRANLCTGYLWLRQQEMRAQPAASAQKEAEEALRAWLEQNAPEPVAGLSGRALHGMGKLYMEWGLWERENGYDSKAENHFRQVLIITPNGIPPRMGLGRLLAVQRGREKEAEAVFREAMKIDPDNIPPRTELGRLLAVQRGREKEAEDVFREALKIDSDNIPIRTELGRMLAEQRGREKEAEEIFRRALEINPDNIPPRTELGRLLGRQHGREREAEKVFRRALEIDPDNIPARTELGRLLGRQRGREAEAEEIFRRALEINPNNIPTCTELGRLLGKQHGREREAEKVFRRALEIDPDNIPVRTELGRLLGKQHGREAEAEALFKRALEIDPDNIPPRTELGRLLGRQRGREKEAEDVLRCNIRLHPTNPHSYSILAKLYERQNRYPEALQLYETLCERSPGNRYGIAGIDRVKQKLEGSESSCTGDSDSQ